jgi:hypothetical protein
LVIFGVSVKTPARCYSESPLTATWTPAIPADGSYQVYARWVAAGSHASNAPYTIKHSAGSATVLVNQRVNGGQWILLGTYTFSAGTAGTVTLTDKANGTVIADAVKLVPTGGGVSRVIHGTTGLDNH